MKLSLVRPFLSLVDLPNQDLPDFTVITGVNGAGKTHLVKALSSGAAVADIAPNSAQDVRLFDWTNLAPKNEGAFSSETLRQERVNLYNQVKKLYDQPWGWQQLFTAARSQGIGGAMLADPELLATAVEGDFLDFANDKRSAASIKLAIEQAVTQFTNNILGNLQAPLHLPLRSIAQRSGRSIIALRESDFLKLDTPEWGQSDLFQHSFARLFVTYRDLHLYNQIGRLAKSEGATDVAPLTEAEFCERHGIPPWDFVNESLRGAGLDFSIDKPNLYSLDPYRPTLKKSSSNIEILFDSLSSGERVIMSFAFAVYYAQDSRQTISRPKLLLLDEVDAPLHPSMCRSLLSTIQRVLVKEYGLRVIMITHSPSTVALSPEEAVYVMKPGLPGLHKTTKDAAIRNLTDGVPTLSIMYEGRRQVFVESPRDVEVYQSAFDALKHHISSEVSLNFIATGVENSAGLHQNTGCAVVKRIVTDIRQAGAKNTYGLIDWDGKNRSEEGIFVLAEGERDGLESVLFDPLLMLNVLIHQFGTKTDTFGLPKGTTFISMAALGLEALQAAIDEIQVRILGRQRNISEEVGYLDGNRLFIDQEYLRMDDHELEQKIEQVFPALKSISKGRIGLLAKWIAQTILVERPEHAPICLLDTLNKLAAN